MKLARFKDQVAVISGAANGIGKACALRFAQEGASVALLDVDADNSKTAAEECRAEGVEALAIITDVKDKAQVESAVKQVLETWGQLNVLVCSAGVYSGSPLESVDEEDWHNTVQTNLSGVFLCNQAVAEVMKAQGSGSIINISSMAGKTSFPATMEYSASKSGIIGLTRSVAMEMANYGVTANTICPGNTKTNMLQQVAEVVAPQEDMTPEAWLEMRSSDAPLGRFAEPWEIAGVAAFLASEDARYITGQAIEVDGGMVLS
ncbi:MAG: SDR family NAD(P)-dependent oxidoreductase [Chloroflexi bacterium]|nr:MAG: SDR family NAD(P)-dependent oxidoreductase [Chloroflexota bacterium]MBL1193040.1 SDR family oxidoreductase [Chloroflexota bacterium]NOH10333.1 SDR family oxidoreductase [Chloroflexota bacterium]